MIWGCAAEEPSLDRAEDKRTDDISGEERSGTKGEDKDPKDEPKDEPDKPDEPEEPKPSPKPSSEPTAEPEPELGEWQKKSLNLFDLQVPIAQTGGQYLALSEQVIKGWNGTNWAEYAVDAPFEITQFKVSATGGIYAIMINGDNIEEIWYWTSLEGWKLITLPQAGLEDFYVASPTDIYGVVANTIFRWQGLQQNLEAPQGQWVAHSVLPGNFVTRIEGYQNNLYAAHGDQFYRFDLGQNNWLPDTDPKEGLQPFVQYGSDELYGIVGDGYQGYAVYTWKDDQWSRKTPFQLGLKPVISYGPSGEIWGAVNSALYKFEEK